MYPDSMLWSWFSFNPKATGSKMSIAHTEQVHSISNCGPLLTQNETRADGNTTSPFNLEKNNIILLNGWAIQLYPRRIELFCGRLTHTKKQVTRICHSTKAWILRDNQPETAVWELTYECASHLELSCSICAANKGQLPPVAASDGGCRIDTLVATLRRRRRREWSCEVRL